ncbi:2-keto-3-deoxygluconate permease [Homoserinimonas aerilata]|uniref:2-keto-3-deoxygluconate permease n=1 Tax=Homoserinimonas aerilata TaxID=1162970 RepID=A0A542XX59_9MICO|nr:2-keto-3-deoxygluconate permease [Homoserinimonas aerilata]TQL40410.1 2-keto-3-deoxygluconate permease [Homoserinimonas aerilata]
MAAGSRIKSHIPLFDGMNKIPGGIMLIPLILGSLVGTFAPDFLEMGNFTTALFKNSALPLIGVLIFATGMQITLKTSGPVLATTGTILLTKSIIPAGLVVLLGSFTGLDGVLGVSILALIVTMDNSNGGLWLAFTGRYGNSTDRGAYMASAINDGPFFSMLFLGAAGLADIPVTLLIAAIIPLVAGIIIGNIDARWTEIMRPVPNIVIPFFAFALGTGINLGNVVSGGLSGILVGAFATLFTGTLAYFGYRWILRRGKQSGIGIASATTAGNAIATPAIIAAADPSFAPYMEVATAQVASAVLVSAVLAPLLAAWVLKRQGGVREVEAPDAADDAPDAVIAESKTV